MPDSVRCLCGEAGRAISLAADRCQHAQEEAEAWPQSGGLRLRLRNPSATNSCCINSTFLTLVHAWAQGSSLPGMLGTLGIRLQALLHTIRPVALRDLPLFRPCCVSGRTPTGSITLLSFSRTSCLSVACPLGRSAGRHETSGAQHFMCWTKARSKHRSPSTSLLSVCMDSLAPFRIVSRSSFGITRVVVLLP